MNRRERYVPPSSPSPGPPVVNTHRFCMRTKTITPATTSSRHSTSGSRTDKRRRQWQWQHRVLLADVYNLHFAFSSRSIRCARVFLCILCVQERLELIAARGPWACCWTVGCWVVVRISDEK